MNKFGGSLAKDPGVTGGTRTLPIYAAIGSEIPCRDSAEIDCQSSHAQLEGVEPPPSVLETVGHPVLSHKKPVTLTSTGEDEIGPPPDVSPTQRLDGPLTSGQLPAPE